MTTVFAIGEKFERLTIISELPRDASRTRQYLVRCDCGTEKAVSGIALRPGDTVSCGCYRRAKYSRGMALRHGDSRGGKRTSEYRSWDCMKQRCLNPNTAGFEHWGGRGIKVCDRWLDSFENFLADMGRKPSPKHSMDRIDNDGDYEPSNCRWATKLEQRLNQRPQKLNSRPGISCPGSPT
jgi:hypothetical protein